MRSTVDLPQARSARLEALGRIELDAAVIGGGIAGAGVARDLALRGVSVALFEKGDYGSGTTSRSSKLIHGGLRYLELYDLRLVRESLRERETLRRLAPQFLRPLPFLLPVYGDSTRSLIKVRLGLALYDRLAPRKGRERYRVLRPVDALALEPGLRAEDLKGAGYFFDDLLLSPERLCLENVLSACRHGASAFNYCEVEEVVRGPGGAEGVRVRDLLSDRTCTVRARVLINASGPWVDRVREAAGISDRGRRLTRTTKGTHCLLPRMTDQALFSPTLDDRMLLVIPWREFSLVGTTDADFDGDPDRVEATGGEIGYLLAEVRRALPGQRVTERDVAYAYAGVRPLSPDSQARPSEVSRTHRVVAEGREGRFLSITGTKLTCFRSLAEQVGDRVVRTLGRRAGSRTARLGLDGWDGEVSRLEAHAWMDVTPELLGTGQPRETIEALVATYGRAYRRVLDLAAEIPEGAERLCPQNPDIVAQLHYSIDAEQAVSLQDVLLRRTGIGTSRCQGRDCAESIGRRMAARLGWSPRRLAAELAAWEAHVARSQRFRSSSR